MSVGVPDRLGSFEFPQPYGSRGIRLTNSNNAPNGVDPRLYSYWSSINNHAGEPDMLVFLPRVGLPPMLLRVDKRSGSVELLREVPWAGTGEGCYWSDQQRFGLYCLSDRRLLRYQAQAGNVEEVFRLDDTSSGDDLWQAHSSADDSCHSATVRRRVNDGPYPKLGTVAVRNGRQQYFERQGELDESQIDKSGQYLVIQEKPDPERGGNNRIIDLDRPNEPRIIADSDGAVGHADVGDGILIGESDQEPGALVKWDLRNAGEPRRLLHQTRWGPGMGHVALRRDFALLSSNATNELLRVPLDGSQQVRPVAPGLMAIVDPDDYNTQLRANVDPTGEWACYATNCGVIGGPLVGLLVQVNG